MNWPKILPHSYTELPPLMSALYLKVSGAAKNYFLKSGTDIPYSLAPVVFDVSSAYMEMN